MRRFIVDVAADDGRPLEFDVKCWHESTGRWVHVHRAVVEVPVAPPLPAAERWVVEARREDKWALWAGPYERRDTCHAVLSGCGLNLSTNYRVRRLEDGEQ